MWEPPPFATVGRRIALVAICSTALLVAAGCGSGAGDSTPSSAPTSAPPTARSTSAPAQVTAADWPTFGHDNARTGVAPGFPAIATPGVAWTRHLDGAVYGQPIVIGTTVYAATENDTVYALASATGAMLWSHHLGTPVPHSKLPCGDIDPLGITGAMVYDPATGLVFAAAETTHGVKTLYGLDAGTGATVVKRNIDPPKGDRIAHQQRSALTLLDGRVFIAYGGLAGDCANYIGSVVAVPTSGIGPNISYAVPTPREGGIWAPGGGSVGPNGHLLYAVGNGENTGGHYDGSDSVLAFDPATLALLDRFSPSSWANDNANDLDLGAMTPAVVGDFVYADGKQGSGYVLRTDHFGGIGGNITTAAVCRAFGAAAVDGTTIFVPCSGGTRALTIGADGSITPKWQAGAPTNGSPVLGGGTLWVMKWPDGTLYGLDPATGAVRTKVDLGEVPHFATPTLAHGTIFVGTMHGVTALR